MSRAKRIRKPPTEKEYLRREIEILETLLRRGGITLVMEDDRLITAYPNGRKVLR